MNDQDIIRIAEGKNVGDLGLGMKPTQKRGDHVNAENLDSNIFPGMLIFKARPEMNWSYVWCPTDESPYAKKFINDCRNEGYVPVIESEWLLNNDGWQWFTPDKRKFRWSVTSMLFNPYDEFLMYRDEARWAQAMEKRANFHTNRIKARQEDSVEQAARTGYDKGLGVEVEAKIGNETITAGGPRRTTVS